MILPRMIVTLILLILACDQCTKLLCARYLTLHQSLPVVKGFFHLTLVHNRGAAFGIGKGHVLFFVFASLCAIVFIVLNFRKSTAFVRCSLALILAGAVGNLIDRLLFGYVVDFLDLRIWPVFNVADSAITVGALLLVYSIFKDSRSPAAGTS